MRTDAAATTGHVLLVRGASALGRAIAGRIEAVGGSPSILDRRTSIARAPAAKVELARPGPTAGAINALAWDHGPFSGLVLCPPPERSVPDLDGEQRWEHRLATEVLEIATVLRAALPRMARRATCTVLVGVPPPGRGSRDHADDTRGVLAVTDEVVLALVRGLVEELTPDVAVRSVPTPGADDARGILRVVDEALDVRQTVTQVVTGTGRSRA